VKYLLMIVLGNIAVWGGFALGWMANGWRTGQRVRQASRSMRYQIATKEEEFQHMREALERARAELMQLRAQLANQDDLTRIPGVGAHTARELNRLGYQSYRDVATWTDDDILRVAEELKAFPSRIARHQWVEQARTLHREKYGQDP
jgi:predicted flap endonuclease-1-like 5' DNA nuclease